MFIWGSTIQGIALADDEEFVDCVATLSKFDEKHVWTEKTAAGWDEFLLPAAFFEIEQKKECGKRHIGVVFKSNSHEGRIAEFREGSRLSYTLRLPKLFFEGAFQTIAAHDVKFK